MKAVSLSVVAVEPVEPIEPVDKSSSAREACARPFDVRDYRAANFFFNSEYPLVRFLERNGYDVAYQSSIDTARFGASRLRAHRLFISSGHDEYWSGRARTAVEAARDGGVHLAFFSCNEAFWRVRFEPGMAEQDGAGAGRVHRRASRQSRA